jgi:hypothetical protein
VVAGRFALMESDLLLLFFLGLLLVLRDGLLFKREVLDLSLASLLLGHLIGIFLFVLILPLEFPLRAWCDCSRTSHTVS